MRTRDEAAAGEPDGDRPCGARDGLQAHSEEEGDPLVPKRSLDRVRQLEVLLGEQVGAGLDDRHRGPQAAVELRELAADVSAADHHEVAGHAGETADRWLDRACAHVQDDDRAAVSLPGDLDGPLGDEAGMAAHEAKARARGRDPARDSALPRAHDRVLPRDDRREVRVHGVRSNSQTATRASHVRRAGARDERLRRGAAGVRAGAAEVRALREEHRLSGARQAGWSGTPA